MPDINLDKETLKMAILLTLKKNADALFSRAQKEPDLRKAAQIYRDIGSELERGADQFDRMENQKDDS